VSLLVVYIKSVVRQGFPSGIFSGNYIRRENIKTKKSNWRRGRDSFSPVVPFLLRSRPPSLPFAMLTFLPLEAFGLASNPTDIKSWRTRSQPIRTFGEITAHIKILPAHQPYLYQKLSQKATQLRLLGMTYQQIAKSLKVNKRTAIRACKYGRR
jgi:hypothetical protein